MVEEIWSDIRMISSEDLFWCLFAGIAVFAAELMLKYRLFPKLGIDRRWAYIPSLNTGVFVFGSSCIGEFGGTVILPLVLAVPFCVLSINIYKMSLRNYWIPIFYFLPVLSFIISAVQLFAFQQISKKVFYEGEISLDNPGNAVVYAGAIFGAALLLTFLIIICS